MLTFFESQEILQKCLLLQAIAKKPKILEVLNTLSEFPDNPAIIAPTIITDEIAFVTDIVECAKKVLRSKQRNIQQILKG